MFDASMLSSDSDTLPPLSTSTSHHDLTGLGMGPPLQRSPYLASISMLSNHVPTCRPVLRRSISLPVVEAPINIPLQQHLQQCGIRRLSTLHPLTVDTPIGPGQLIDRYIHDPHHTSTPTSRSPSSTLTAPTSKIPFALSPIPHDETCDAGIPMGDDHICAVRMSWCIAFFHISCLSINTYRRKSVTFAPDTVFVEKPTSTSPSSSRSYIQPTISTPDLPPPCHVSQLRIAVPPRTTYSYHINGSTTGCFHSDDEIPSFSHLPPPSTKNITTSPSPSTIPRSTSPSTVPTLPRSRAERAAAFKQRRADLAAKTSLLIQQREKFRNTERSLMADDVAEHSSSSASTSSDEMENETTCSRKRARDDDECISSIRHTKQRLDADTALPASVCIPSVTSASPTGCSPSASSQTTGATTYISYLQ